MRSEADRATRGDLRSIAGLLLWHHSPAATESGRDTGVGPGRARALGSCTRRGWPYSFRKAVRMSDEVGDPEEGACRDEVPAVAGAEPVTSGMVCQYPSRLQRGEGQVLVTDACHIKHAVPRGDLSSKWVVGVPDVVRMPPTRVCPSML